MIRVRLVAPASPAQAFVAGLLLGAWLLAVGVFLRAVL